MPDRKRPLPYPEVDIAEVREYANRRADATSVRQVAREIGMRHTALAKFLAGSAPYAKTRVPLCEWYLRAQKATSAPAPAAQDAALATDPLGHLEALLADLRGEARTEARVRIATALTQAYSRMGRPAPDWLYDTR